MGAGLKTWLMSQLDIVTDAYVFPRSGNRPFSVVAARVNQPEDVQRIVEAAARIPRVHFLSEIPRWLVIVDEDAEIRDFEDLIWRFTLAVRPHEDVVATQFQARGAPMLVIDATFKNKPNLDWGPGSGDPTDPPVAKTSAELRQRVRARWHELGLD
jgi:3-polyprenyl-4-hydroxybenzoate decarboxylase